MVWVTGWMMIDEEHGRGLFGAVVLWCCGIVVLWYCGTVVLDDG